MTGKRLLLVAVVAGVALAVAGLAHDVLENAAELLAAPEFDSDVPDGDL
jgi:hypothetical protein